MGSVKQQVVDDLTELEALTKIRFVGSHPMAGGEKVGVQQAREDLCEGAVCAVTPTLATDSAALESVQSFWQALGMRVIQLDPVAHDQLVCRTSHVPHLLSSVLAGYVLDPKFPEAQRQLCAGGFRDTTRVASGPVEMWRGILESNRENLLKELETLGDELSGLKDAVANGDFDAVETVLRNGFERRERWLREMEGGS